MWFAILSTCLCTTTAQFNPFDFGRFSGPQNFDNFAPYGSSEFGLFQGVSADGRDFNVNSLAGYGVPNTDSYGGQPFAAQDFVQYNAQGYPREANFPQAVNQNHLRLQGSHSPGHAVQHEMNIQHRAPDVRSFAQGGQLHAPVIGQPGQSVLIPGHQQNTPLPNHINAGQSERPSHSQGHHAQQRLPPLNENSTPHHHQQSNKHHGALTAPASPGGVQIDNGHVPPPHNAHADYAGLPLNQYDVNYNGASRYSRQYQRQQLWLQVPHQYQRHIQHQGEKRSASSPSAASTPLGSNGFKGIPLEAFTQQNAAYQTSSPEVDSQRLNEDQLEATSKGEIKKSS